VDGPGLRYVIFTQGCRHQCPKCHNPESWDMEGGKEFTIKQIIRMMKQQKKHPHAEHNSLPPAVSKIRGITFSGGEPFLQAGDLAKIAHEAHEIKWDVVTYTGFTYEELIELALNDTGIKELLDHTDLLIDGKFIQKLKSAKLHFRGSSNQRLIDMTETRKNGIITLWQETTYTKANKD